MKALYYSDKGVFDTIEALFFYLIQFRSLGARAEIKNNFFRFFVQMRIRRFAFENYRPLGNAMLKVAFLPDHVR